MAIVRNLAKLGAAAAFASISGCATNRNPSASESHYGGSEEQVDGVAAVWHADEQVSVTWLGDPPEGGAVIVVQTRMLMDDGYPVFEFSCEDALARTCLRRVVTRPQMGSLYLIPESGVFPPSDPRYPFAVPTTTDFYYFVSNVRDWSRVQISWNSRANVDGQPRPDSLSLAGDAQ
jgi:hypothetical protein